jgi:hypothetical protein
MMMMIVEHLVDRRLAGETEVLGENLPQRHFVQHTSQARTRAHRRGKPATNPLSYDVAYVKCYREQLINFYLNIS